MLNRLIIACLLLAVAFPAWAVEKPLADPAQEARAYALFHQIRCAACQSESLADSSADVAMDMRQAIRVHVAAGDSDDDIKAMLTSRYGNSIMMWTPLTVATALLWFGPTALLILVVVLIGISLKKGK